MLIKAGTYRFNDVLTAPSDFIDQSVNFTLSTVHKSYGVDLSATCDGIHIDGDPAGMSYHVVSTVPDLSATGTEYPLNVLAYLNGWNLSYFDEGIRTITIPNDSDVSEEFYEWFTANAVEQKEISGKWRFKDEITAPAGGVSSGGVNFTTKSIGYIVHCNDLYVGEYPEMTYVVDSAPAELEQYLGSLGVTLPWPFVVVSGGKWDTDFYGEGVKTIDFGTEPQLVSADFYNWLTANASQPMASIQYNGSTISNLFGGQTATLKCKGMKMEDDVVVEVAEQQTKEVTITENGTIEITPDSGFGGLSKIVLTVNVEGGGSGGGNTVEIVSWADGTDEQIAAMVAALDDGTITIEDTGWKIGDERIVSLSAMDATGVGESHITQDVTLVLMDSQHYFLTEVTAGGSLKDHFVVGLKHSLYEKGYVNSSDTNSGSWKGCARRTWCNNVFRGAIPEKIRGCFKQFRVITAEEYNNDSVTQTDDYFALFAEKEIFGSGGFSTNAEADALFHVEWYKTKTNRIKKVGDEGSAASWWTRTPNTNNREWFFVVSKDGSTVAGNPASYNLGIAPFGCI